MVDSLSAGRFRILSLQIQLSLLHTETHVKDSAEFAERIQNVPADSMVSFSVVSLFTKVPLKEALEYISHLPSSDNTFKEWTNIPADALLCELTELCLRATYFKFEDQFYEEVDGVAMDSSLSPIIENKALTTASS